MVRPEGSILDAYFTGRSIALSGDLYQYDYGQILRFNNVDLPEHFEVHFSNHESVGTSSTAMGTNAQVAIPDKYLLTGLPIYFWVYLHDAPTDGETEYNATITVIARPKPEDYIHPVERDFIAQAIDALNVSVVEANEAAESAEKSAVKAEESAANVQHYAELAEQSAQSASQYSQSAGKSAETAEQYKTSASRSAEDASSSASSAAESASHADLVSGQIDQKASDALQDISEAKTDAISNVDSAKSSALSEISSAQSSAVKAVGDKGKEVLDSIPVDYRDLMEDVTSLKSAILTEKAKLALLNCFSHVAWIDEHGIDLYEDLRKELYKETNKLTASITLGTHNVYTTDNIESLRPYIQVVFNDEQSIIVTDYDLDGDISRPGSRRLAILYSGYITFVYVSVVIGSIIYEWDFTQSITDLRQCKIALLGTGEAMDDPKKSTGTTPPTRNETGIIFSDAQQFVRLLGTDILTSDFIIDKTVEIDIASFNFGSDFIESSSLVYNKVCSTYGLRLLYFATLNDHNKLVFSSGFSYASSFSDPSISSMGWCMRIESFIADVHDKWTSEEKISNSMDMIDGHTISLYFSSDNRIFVYIDRNIIGSVTFKDTADRLFYGLQIGSGARLYYGGSFFNAVVTGARICSGNAAGGDN